MADLKLIVGLGNPGAEHLRTRHNAGFWLVDALAQAAGETWRHNGKLHGQACQLEVGGVRLRLLKPSTYMNESGLAVASALRYLDIAPAACLVVHDDMDLPPGTARLKFDGGHGGHNGLRSIFAHLGHGRFHRLRIGIGHPAQREAVLPWVLGQPSAADEGAILDAVARGLHVLPLAVTGRFDEAMKRLHTSGNQHLGGDGGN